MIERFWRRRLGGNQNVLGTMLRIDGRSVPIVGIIPAVFASDQDPELWCRQLARIARQFARIVSGMLLGGFVVMLAGYRRKTDCVRSAGVWQWLFPTQTEAGGAI